MTDERRKDTRLSYGESTNGLFNTDFRYVIVVINTSTVIVKCLYIRQNTLGWAFFINSTGFVFLYGNRISLLV
jgi:hypothetical protein